MIMDGWVNIKIRPPENEQPILITDGNIVVSVIARVRGNKVEWDPSGWGGYEWDYEFEDDDITHWMPAPQLPDKQDLVDLNKETNE